MPLDNAENRIAYLTGEYPAVSHTFILREVEALRALGLDVVTCSIRQTGAEHHRGPSEKHAVETTFYVLKAAKNPITLLKGLFFGLRQPGRFFAALGLAWRTRPPGAKALAYQLFYFLEALVLSHHLHRQGVRHLHNHFGNSSCSVAMLTSVCSGIPFSYTMHGPAIFFEPRIWRIDEKIARAKFVSCISHFCRSQGMIFADPKHWEKMPIVHCAITPERYTPPADKPAGKSLIFVGRLAAVKGVVVLIEAFARVLKDHPDARLTLVGDGAERPAIEARIKALGCEDAVHLTGYLSQDEVAAALSKADIFALPSFAEGVPVVLMEAMASGLPVIATRIAGIPELVEYGVNGLTAPPGDEDAMTDAIKTLLDDPAMRAQMGAAGLEKVAKDYNQATEAAWLKEFIVAEKLPSSLRP